MIRAGSAGGAGKYACVFLQAEQTKVEGLEKATPLSMVDLS